MASVMARRLGHILLPRDLPLKATAFAITAVWGYEEYLVV